MQTDAWLAQEAEMERRLLARRPDPELEAWLGTALHAELRELVRATRRMRGGPRVLVLPGIMGSTLGIRRPGRPDDVKWFDPLEIALGGLVKLALPSSRRIQPLGVLLFAYLRLKLSLRAAGFDADFHPYDWRHSVHDAGRGLAERIEHEPRRKVSLVAHSMGGLVARAALAHAGAARIERVVQLGTPNAGAFAAVQALRGTYPLVRRLALLDLAHDARQLARDVFCTLPGLAELLPEAAACEGFDPFKAADWPRGPRPKAELLAATRRARAALPPPDGRFALVAGRGRETLTGLRLRDGRLEFRDSDDGDGTVPLALARMPGLATWITKQSHGAMPGDDLVTRAVVDLLGAGDTGLLPRDVPAPVRRGRWREEPDPGEAAEPLFWDDLSGPERREFLHEFMAVPEPSTRRAEPAGAERTPVELHFELGGIESADAEAIGLGLFDNVAPAGAATAVDALLGGLIRDLGRRRAISAAAGEVFILPSAQTRLAARYVVFAGLGHFGRYGSPVQRLAAANLVRTLSLAGVREIAWVLWGTASGVPAAHAAQAQLAGLLEALAQLEPARWPRRITLMSRSPKRLAAARAAMEMFLATSPKAGRVALGPGPAATAARKDHPVPARAGAASYLFVQQAGEDLRAALLGVTAKGTALAATRRLDLRALDRHLGQLGDGLDEEGIEDFGEQLAGLLLPAPVQEALSAVRESPLVVVHDDAASRWPWETLRIGGWAPACAAGMARRYAAEDLSVAKWSEERRLSPRLEMLLVVNPTEDLPGAQQEGERLLRVLEGTDAAVTRLRGSEATRARLLEEFRSGRHDVIHYAGHAYFDPVSPASSGILCAGGRVLSGSDLASLDTLPALVCFNACESGRVRQAAQVQRALGRSTGFAEAFLRGGVANFIGTWWPVSDAAAARFATVFYQQVMQGAAVGPALNAARNAVRRLGSGDWANYLHYGAFDFTLKR